MMAATPEVVIMITARRNSDDSQQTRIFERGYG